MLNKIGINNLNSLFILLLSKLTIKIIKNKIKIISSLYFEKLLEVISTSKFLFGRFIPEKI